MMLLAVINGAVRDFVYKPFVGNLPAHQISTAVLLLLLAGYFWRLRTVWPLPSGKHAWIVGILWFLMTGIFEFGMGAMRGLSAEESLHAYNLADGEVWLFIPLWVLVGPYVLHRFVHPPGVS